MPRRTKEQKYENYQMIKQFYQIHKYVTDMSEIGDLMDSKSEKILSDSNIYTASVDIDPHSEKILGLDFTQNLESEDQSELLQKIKNSYKRIGDGIRKYDGPFKEILEASHYISDPSNGDILDAFVDQPSLARILSTFSSGPSFADLREVEVEIDDPVNKGQKKKKTVKEHYIDLENMNKRKEALGEFGDYLTDYYVATKDLVKVIYDRQKAEKEDKKGLDAAYMMKYAAAIDNFTAKFDKLKLESEKRYARTDLTQEEKDLTSIEVKNPKAGKLDEKNKKQPDTISLRNLNNPLSDYTSSNPKKYNRDAIPVAVANMKGQSQAIKNGWPLAEYKLLGYISEAKEDIENTLKTSTISIKDSKGTINRLDKEIERFRKENNEEKLKESIASKKALEESLARYEQVLKDAEAAKKDINAIYDKYYDVKNPDIVTRREALKEAEVFNNKYKDKSVISVSKRTFEAIEDEIKDPYELEGKTRLEQAESMLKSIKDVDKTFRSSDNFRKVKTGLEKLVEMAKKYPNMNEEQFWDYQKQLFKVKGYVNVYLKGKNKEASDYAKKNKGKELKRSEYTSKRINAVNSLWDKLECHLSLTSGEFTKEYTGNEKERALAKYERLVRMEGEHRQSILGKNKISKDYEEYDRFDIKNEYASFLKSLYLEKMKHRFDTDPTFTAKDFYKSLNSKEISDGVNKMHKEMDPDFKKRIKASIRERIHLEGEEDSDYLVEDKYFYSMVASDSPVLFDIPKGVGHDYIKFEYRMELIRNDLADESVFDKDDYIGGPQYEPDEWEIEKYNIKQPEEEKKAEEKPEAEEEKKAEIKDEKKVENKEPKKEEKKPEVKEEKKEEKKPEIKEPKKEEKKPEIKKPEIKEEKKAPKKEEKKNEIKEEKKAPKKEEKKTEKKSGKDSLAAQIAVALTSDRLYEVSRDPLYRSIVSDIYVHAKKEKPGENTKISDETIAKMAKFIDKISDISNYTQDDFTRRHLVESAYNQYRQKPEDFEKNCSKFDVRFPNGKDSNPVHFCYRDIYHEQHSKRIKETVAAYSKTPENKKLEASVMDEAYQVLMVNIVNLTVGMEKGGKITTYNRALDSTDNRAQREDFIKTQLSDEFKKNFREGVLELAKAGKLNGSRILDMGETALAKMLDNNKKKKDVLGERNTRNLIDKLKLPTGSINKKVEVMNRKQAEIKK